MPSEHQRLGCEATTLRETGGRLGGRRHVLISLIVLTGITGKERPDSNLREFSKLQPGLVTA